jgi:hypothetical protein
MFRRDVLYCMIPSMCKFQDNVPSIVKPRNLIWETSVITLLLHANTVSVDTLFFVLKYIQCVFKKIIVNIFDLNQLCTNLRFVFNCRSIGIVCSRTKGHGVFFSIYITRVSISNYYTSTTIVSSYHLI